MAMQASPAADSGGQGAASASPGAPDGAAANDDPLSFEELFGPGELCMDDDPAYVAFARVEGSAAAGTNEPQASGTPSRAASPAEPWPGAGDGVARTPASRPRTPVSRPQTATPRLQDARPWPAAAAGAPSRPPSSVGAAPPPQPPPPPPVLSAEEDAVLAQARELRRLRARARQTPAQEPKPRPAHRDALLDEMKWMAKEFQRERAWRVKQARRWANACKRSGKDLESREAVREREEAKAVERRAAWIGREVAAYWAKARRLAVYRANVREQTCRAETADRQLNFLLEQTQRYSRMLADRLRERRGEAPPDAERKHPPSDGNGSDAPDGTTRHAAEPRLASADRDRSPSRARQSSPPRLPSAGSSDASAPPSSRPRSPPPAAAQLDQAAADDEDDYSGDEDDADDEATLDEEARVAREEGRDEDEEHRAELAGLEADANVPIEVLLARYGRSCSPAGSAEAQGAAAGAAMETDDEGDEGTEEGAPAPSGSEDDYSGDEDDADDEATLEEEARAAREEGRDEDEEHRAELAALEADADVPIEVLLARYGHPGAAAASAGSTPELARASGSDDDSGVSHEADAHAEAASEDDYSGDEDDADDEATLEEEARAAREEGRDEDEEHRAELAGLEADADVPIEVLLARYGHPGAAAAPAVDSDVAEGNVPTEAGADEEEDASAAAGRDPSSSPPDEDDADDYSADEDDADDEMTLEEEARAAREEGRDEDEEHKLELQALTSEADVPLVALLGAYRPSGWSGDAAADAAADADDASPTAGRKGEPSSERAPQAPVKPEPAARGDDSMEVDATASPKEEPPRDASSPASAPGSSSAQARAQTRAASPPPPLASTASPPSAAVTAPSPPPPPAGASRRRVGPVPLPFLLRANLRWYQREGLDWLVTLHDRRLNGILADEMGLGKTLQTISLLAHLACEYGDFGPHLVVVPTSVMLNWEMEFKRFCPALRLLVYYGSAKERQAKRQGWSKPNAFHVCITSYTLILQDARVFRRKKWKYLILDEAHMIKNWRSARWQTLLNFQAKRRLLVTGTPLQNDLMELWSLMHFLMPAVFASHDQFRDWFSQPLTGMVEDGQAEGAAADAATAVAGAEDALAPSTPASRARAPSSALTGPAARLHEALRPFVLRRLKKDVEKGLPPKHEHVVYCELSRRQRALYEEFIGSTAAREAMSSGGMLGVMNVLMQLRKVCNHPDLFAPRPVESPLRLGRPYVRVPTSLVSFATEAWGGAPGSEDAERSPASRPFPAPGDEASERPPAPPFSPAPAGSRLAAPWGLAGSLPAALDLFARASIPASSALREIELADPEAAEALAWPLDGRQDPGELLRCRLDERRPPPPRLPDDLAAGPPASSSSPLEDRCLQCALRTEAWAEDRVTDAAASCSLEEWLGRPLAARSLAAVQASLAETRERARARRSERARRLAVAQTERLERLRRPSPIAPDLVAACIVAGTPAAGGLWAGRDGDGPARGAGRPSARLDDPLDLPHVPLSLRGLLVPWDERAEAAARDVVRLPSFVEPAAARPLELLALGRGAERAARVSGSALSDAWPPVQLASPAEVTAARAGAKARGRAGGGEGDSAQAAVTAAAAAAAGAAGEPPPPPPPPPASKAAPSALETARASAFPDPKLVQYDAGKLQALAPLLSRLIAGGHRALIFTQMSRMLDVLEAFLNLQRIAYARLDGGTKPEARALLTQRFNADERLKVFILSTRSGGVGLNLTGADTVIFYDADWNPAMDAQAQDRCHRIGQTRPVHIYRLVTRHTVEENILRKSDQKRQLDYLAIQSGQFTTAGLELGAGEAPDAEAGGKGCGPDGAGGAEAARRRKDAGEATPSGREIEDGVADRGAPDRSGSAAAKTPRETARNASRGAGADGRTKPRLSDGAAADGGGPSALRTQGGKAASEIIPPAAGEGEDEPGSPTSSLDPFAAALDGTAGVGDADSDDEGNERAAAARERAEEEAEFGEEGAAPDDVESSDGEGASRAAPEGKASRKADKAVRFAEGAAAAPEAPKPPSHVHLEPGEDVEAYLSRLDGMLRPVERLMVRWLDEDDAETAEALGSVVAAKREAEEAERRGDLDLARLDAEEAEREAEADDGAVGGAALPPDWDPVLAEAEYGAAMERAKEIDERRALMELERRRKLEERWARAIAKAEREAAAAAKRAAAREAERAAAAAAAEAAERAREAAEAEAAPAPWTRREDLVLAVAAELWRGGARAPDLSDDAAQPWAAAARALPAALADDEPGAAARSPEACAARFATLLIDDGGARRALAAVAAALPSGAEGEAELHGVAAFAAARLAARPIDAARMHAALRALWEAWAGRPGVDHAAPQVSLAAASSALATLPDAQGSALRDAAAAACPGEAGHAVVRRAVATSGLLFAMGPMEGRPQDPLAAPGSGVVWPPSPAHELSLPRPGARRRRTLVGRPRSAPIAFTAEGGADARSPVARKRPRVAQGATFKAPSQGATLACDGTVDTAGRPGFGPPAPQATLGDAPAQLQPGTHPVASPHMQCPSQAPVLSHVFLPPGVSPPRAPSSLPPGAAPPPGPLHGMPIAGRGGGGPAVALQQQALLQLQQHAALQAALQQRAAMQAAAGTSGVPGAAPGLEPGPGPAGHGGGAWPQLPPLGLNAPAPAAGNGFPPGFQGLPGLPQGLPQGLPGRGAPCAPPGALPFPLPAMPGQPRQAPDGAPHGPPGGLPSGLAEALANPAILYSLLQAQLQQRGPNDFSGRGGLPPQ